MSDNLQNLHDCIQISKSGIFKHKWDHKKKVGTKTRVKALFTVLTKSVVFTDDLTVGDLVKAISKYQDVEMIFYSHMGGSDFKKFVADMQGKPEKKDDQEVEYCEIHWCTDVIDEQYNDYVGFHGIGKISEKEAKEIWKMKPGADRSMSFAMELTPIKEYKHMLIKLNKEYIIEKYEMKDKNKKIKRTRIYKGEKDFTVFEAIGAFLFEISFFGNPEDRQKMSIKLDTIHKKAKKELGINE